MKCISLTQFQPRLKMKIIILFGPASGGKSYLVHKFNHEHPDMTVHSNYEFPDSYERLIELPHTRIGDNKTFVFELLANPSAAEFAASLTESGHYDVHTIEVGTDRKESNYQTLVDAIIN